MLKRKIYDKLVEWKKKKGRECLLVKGARQIGKTYIIDMFGRNNYKSYIYVNFVENPILKDVFNGVLSADEILKKLSVYMLGIKFIPHDTLIFLDEIQECPNARTALKFLALEEKYDVIASGSLLGINYREVNSIPVGYERQITMYGLDFEEFLWAKGASIEMLNYVKSFYLSRTKIPDDVNEIMMDYLHEFIVVGGMPDVVNTFLRTNNYNEVQLAQEKIILSYYEDMIKYATQGDKPKVRRCYDSIPRQLAKDNKKFQYSVVEKKSTARKYEDSVEWLVDANVVYRCRNVSNPTFPLEAYASEDQYKIYFSDTGLLTAMYGFDIKAKILNNTIIGPAKGGIYENLVAEMFAKKGYKLYYYKTTDSTQEIEFLLTLDGEIVPVEVKSGNSRCVSLNKFIERFQPAIAYKLIRGNIGVSDAKVTMPLYMAMFLDNTISR